MEARAWRRRRGTDVFRPPGRPSQKNQAGVVDDVVSRPASRTAGERLSSLAAAVKRYGTREIVPEWQDGASALRRATACSGGGGAATTRGGR